MAARRYINETQAEPVAAEYLRRNPGSMACVRPHAKGGYGVRYIKTGKASVGNWHWLNESEALQYLVWSQSRISTPTTSLETVAGEDPIRLSFQIKVF